MTDAEIKPAQRATRLKAARFVIAPYVFQVCETVPPSVAEPCRSARVVRFTVG